MSNRSNGGRRNLPRPIESSPLDRLADLLVRLVKGAAARLFGLFQKPGTPVHPQPHTLDEVSVFHPRSWQATAASVRAPTGIRAESRSPRPRTASERGDAPLPYVPARALLSKGERAFWHPLMHAVGGKYRVFCKVRLADVVCCPPDRRDERRWFRKIGRYHVDFVVCDPKTTAPLLVVELDGRRHREPIARERDRFKDAVLQAARIPILRVPAQQAYDTASLRQNLTRLINGPGPGLP